MGIDRFSKGNVVRGIVANEERSIASTPVNTMSAGDLVRGFDGYADIKSSDIQPDSIFNDTSFGRFRTSTHVNERRYVAIPKNAWAIYDIHEGRKQSAITELSTSSKFWFTEDAGGFCFVLGDNGGLEIGTFDGNAYQPIVLTSPIPYSDAMDVAVLASGELLVLQSSGAYYIVNAYGTVTSGTYLSSSTEKVFVEKVGNSVSYMATSSGDIYSGITTDGKRYYSVDDFANNPRNDSFGLISGAPSSYFLIDTIGGATMVSSDISQDGYSVFVGHDSGQSALFITSGGYEREDLDLSAITALTDQDIVYGDVNGLNLVAHAISDNVRYYLTINNADTLREMVVWKGDGVNLWRTLEPQKSSTDDIFYMSPSAPDRFSGVRETFFMDVDSAKNLSICLKDCRAYSTTLVTAVVAEERLTEPVGVLMPQTLTSITELEYQDWPAFVGNVFNSDFIGIPEGQWKQAGTGTLGLNSYDGNLYKSGRGVTWNSRIQITSVAGIGGGNGSVFGFDASDYGVTLSRMYPQGIIVPVNIIGFAYVSGTSGGADDGRYVAFFGGLINPGAGKSINGVLFFNSAFGYLDADNFTTNTVIDVSLAYGALVSEADPRPVSAFTVSNTNPSTSTVVTLTSTSEKNPDTFSWLISGGSYTLQSGYSLTDSEIQLTFDDSATGYSARLSCSNKYGSNITSYSRGIVTT